MSYVILALLIGALWIIAIWKLMDLEKLGIKDRADVIRKFCCQYKALLSPARLAEKKPSGSACYVC